MQEALRGEDRRPPFGPRLGDQVYSLYKVKNSRTGSLLFGVCDFSMSRDNGAATREKKKTILSIEKEE